MKRRTIARLVLVAAAYVVAGKLGLSLAVVHPSASAIWAPTGIAIASFVLFGRSVWPGVFAAALVVNVTTAGSLLSSAAIATGNTLEGLLGAGLVLTFGSGARAFERVRDVFVFAAAACVAAIVSAGVGVTALAIAGYARWTSFGEIWTTWWLGDVAGALIVAPLLITWATRPSIGGRHSRAELGALSAMVIVTGGLVFGGWSSLSASSAPIAFVTFPVLALAAYRYGPRGAALSVALLAAVAEWGTLNGTGPFARGAPNEALLFVQSFMGVIGVTSLTLAAADVERRRSDAALRAGEERLRLAEARKVAERDEFLSIAAHELRTPITTLQLGTQLLLRQIERGAVPGSADLSRALMRVADQGSKLDRLVRQLLDNVRVDADRLTLSPEIVDVSALVASVVEEFRHTRGSRILLVTTPAPASIDPVRIEQVVRNLLDNALRFSPEGSSVEIRAGMAEGTRVAVSVRDHGPGVAPELRPTLFERYKRPYGAHAHGGLGLGLYVSRQIVALHGGRIEAEFPADGGTRVVVTLPAAMVAEPIGS